jgi:hypothetical protein
MNHLRLTDKNFYFDYTSGIECSTIKTRMSKFIIEKLGANIPMVYSIVGKKKL